MAVLERTVETEGLPARVVLAIAAACGLSVAHIYVAHPLLDAMARDLALLPAHIGAVVTWTQVGYALGLVFIVPLGDLVDRRRLVVGQGLVSAIALVVVACAPSGAVLFAGLVAVGLLAVVIQVLVAFAAALAAPGQQGRVVGIVTGGVVTGILSARIFAGVLADLGGWRLVYLTLSGLTLGMALVLARVLPPRAPAGPGGLSYPALLRSMVLLFREERVLRLRAAFAFLIFATFNVLWAPLVLPLSGPPWSLPHSVTGLFGLAGLAGALSAGRAGQLADRGLARRTTGVALVLMLLAWGPIAVLGWFSGAWVLAALVLGILLLDLAIQAVHVTNQSLIFPLRPEARSRLVGGYMVFYSLGSAAGALSATMAYAAAGWPGVCLLGAGLSAAALVLWAVAWE